MEPGNQLSASAASAPAIAKLDGLTASVTPKPDEFQMVALSRIHESPTNPRQTFNQAKLEELAQSMRPPGRMLIPLVGRISPFEKKDYELIDGARRYRAAKIAGLSLVPLIVVEMSDVQVLESQLITNAQREDWPELEEAAGYQALMTASKQTVDQIAAKVGKSRETIYARLKLLSAIPDVRDALTKGKITAGHAILIVRLQPKQQKKALDACFDWRESLVPVRALDDWLDSNIRCELKDAPFRQEDAKLVPAAGSCTDCEKRDGKRCLDPDCYQRKVAAHVESKRVQLASAKGGFVEISDTYGRTPKGAIERILWNEVPAGQSGPDVKRALVVNGDNAGKVIYVKIRAPHKPEPKRDWEAERAKEKAKRDREIAVRERILDAILEKVKAPLDRADLEDIAASMIDGRGDELIARRHGVAASGNYDPKLGQKIIALIPAMKPQELARFLIELALADEIESVAQAGKIPDGLAGIAKRYKVNPEKIRTDAEREWKSKVQPSAQLKTAAAGGAK